jgi:hypothetical protein
MSFENNFYIKDDIIYLHFNLLFLNENKLTNICEYIYNNYFIKYNDIRIEMYLDKIKINYFVEHLNTIIKYGKLIKENFSGKEVKCNIYSCSKTVKIVSKLINEIDKDASTRITFHEIDKETFSKIVNHNLIR